MQSSDENYIKENIESEIKFYVRKEERYGEQRYEEIEEVNCEWCNVIADKKENGNVKVHDVLKPLVWPTQRDETPPFNQEITNSIEQGEAIAALDATRKDITMAGHWIIADRRKELHLQNTLYHKKWGNNTIVGAETITLLELFEVLWRKGKHINRGKIEIGFDKKKPTNK
jgi:hypothetical protein